LEVRQSDNEEFSAIDVRVGEMEKSMQK